MTTAEEVGAVRDNHRFDEGVLAAYLADRLPGFAGPLTVRQFDGGQSNPTFFLATPGARYVLRKKPPGPLLPSAHQIEREYRVMKALAATDVPVPQALLLCEDPAIVGTSFFIMEMLDGRVFRAPLLPDCASAERAAIYDAMNDVLARLHAVDWRAVGLGDFGRPDAYVERQIARWTSQYEAAKSDPIPAMDRLIAWLPAHIPPAAPTTIAHGDYRLENMIFHASEPRVIGVLDWELATLGHPAADLAYNCLVYHYPPEVPALAGLGGRDLTALGIPTEAEYVAAYARRTGRDATAHHPYFLAFSLFRLASITQGIAYRARTGSASSARATQVGSMAGFFAELAWRIAEGRA